MQRSFRTPKGTDLPLLNLRGREYLEVKYRLVWFREEHPDWSIETEILSLSQDSAYARATIKDDKGRIIATSHKFETRQGFPDFIEKAETGAIGRALALIGYGTQFCADELDEGERIVDAPVERRAGASSGGERMSQSRTDSRPEHRAGSSAASSGGAGVSATAGAGATNVSRSAGTGATTGATTSASTGAAPGASRGLSPSTAPGEAFVAEPFGAEPAPLVSETSAEEGASASGGSASTGIPKDPGEYRIQFGRKYKGMRLKDIPRSELEGYVEWLEDNASKKGLPLSEEARFLKVAVSRYIQQAGPSASGSATRTGASSATEGPSH